MKKFIYSAMAVAMLATTSCQDDLANSFVGEEATVEFNISTPEIATRAYSDGSKATVLQYAIYDEAGNELTALTHSVTNENAEEIKGSAKISLQLKNNKDYQIVVWAAAPNAPYTINFDDKTMTVNYDADKTICNDENRDAFYAYQEFTVDQNTTIDVKLKRPFAQLNIGAGDFTQSANSGYTPTKSYVKVPAYSTLNFADGSVDGQDVREFKLHYIPVESEDFPYDPDKTDAVKPYRYLAMNYILVGADQELVDIEFGHSNGNEGDTRTVGSVPVQRNYRTNIYGNILTSSTDVNVEILPDYEDEKLIEFATVSTAQQLQEAIDNAPAGKTLEIVLTNDITLSKTLIFRAPSVSPAPAVRSEEAATGSFVLDLNGQTFSSSSDAAEHNSMIVIENNCKLVVTDSEGNGKISYNYIGQGDSSFGWGSYTIENRGELEVNEGTIEMICNLNPGSGNSNRHMYCAIQQASGSTIINGGKISTPTYRSIRINRGALTINGGEMDGQVWMQPFEENTSITITDGVFAPSGNDRSSVFVENGSKVVTMNVTGGYFATKIGCSDFTKNGVNGSVSGGEFSEINENLIAEGCCKDAITDGDNIRYRVGKSVAKVGNTEYTTIDKAIAAWTNGSTLTLLSDVTLSNVVTLKSTEHHILNLGTYTMTAASKKNAIEITCDGRSSASYALTINADATNPGGITATGKSCIYYKKSDSTKDRPIIRIYNGVFTGSYSINSTSNGNTNCPQIWIYGGVFNSYMNLTKNMLRVFGGTFHGAINCTGDSSAYREISGGRFKSWQFMTADADTKFWVGTAKATYNVGVYVDDEGYLVVGGPVITEFGDKFEAKAADYSKWSSYLKYSSAATNGLYYTNADMAIAKHGAANVELK